MNVQRRYRPARGLARYLRRQLAAARRSGDPRRIAAAEAEASGARLAAARTTDQLRSRAESASGPSGDEGSNSSAPSGGLTTN
jgi:hypothetical protein